MQCFKCNLDSHFLSIKWFYVNLYFKFINFAFFTFFRGMGYNVFYLFMIVSFSFFLIANPVAATVKKEEPKKDLKKENQDNKPSTVKITKVFEFAGEEVR